MVNIHTARTALYRFYDSDDVLLYVGITNITQVRWAAHALKPWWKQVARKEAVWFENRAAAARAEVLAIRHEKPRYNIANAWYATTKLDAVNERARRTVKPELDVSLARDDLERQLVDVASEWRRSRSELDEANADLRALLVRGRAEGLGPSKMARLSGYTREWISKIAPDPRRVRDDD